MIAHLTNTKIGLISNIPRPYRIPLYSKLNALIQGDGDLLRIFYYSNPKYHKRRKEILVEKGDYPSEFVKGIDIPIGYERVITLPIGIWQSISKFKPDVLISGAFGLVGYLGWLYTRKYNKPYIQWSGATLLRKKQYGAFTLIIQRWLTCHSEACITYGTAASNYLMSLGARPERIVTGVNAIDHSFFQKQYTLRSKEANLLRVNSEFEGVNLLVVGNLVPLKGIDYLIQALLQLPTQVKPYHLHFVGGGPQESELHNKLKELRLEERVHFWGACQPHEVPLYYAISDVLVFPSLYDIWGLVLNEAMACGLPVIASSLAGATIDLVEDGVNGFVVDPRDTSLFAEKIKRLINEPELRARFGAAAKATIENKATIEHSAAAFMKAIDLVSQ